MLKFITTLLLLGMSSVAMAQSGPGGGGGGGVPVYTQGGEFRATCEWCQVNGFGHNEMYQAIADHCMANPNAADCDGSIVTGYLVDTEVGTIMEFSYAFNYNGDFGLTNTWNVLGVFWHGNCAYYEICHQMDPLAP